MANIFKKLFTKRKQPTKSDSKAIDIEHARNSLNLTIDRNTRLVNYCYDNVKNNANELNSINQKIEDNYNEFVNETSKTNDKLNVVENTSNKNSEEILASQKEINNIDLKLIEITNDLKDLKPFRFVGIYDSTITYKINDLVEDNGALYLSIVDNNINNPTSDKDKWLLLDKPIPPIDLTPYLDKTTNMDQDIVGFVNVKDPISDNNIANKKYVDNQNTNYLNKITSSEQTINGKVNVSTPTSNNHIANKAYVDSKSSSIRIFENSIIVDRLSNNNWTNFWDISITAHKSSKTVAPIFRGIGTLTYPNDNNFRVFDIPLLSITYYNPNRSFFTNANIYGWGNCDIEYKIKYQSQDNRFYISIRFKPFFSPPANSTITFTLFGMGE